MNVREQVWSTAWASVANANDCKDAEVATMWADKCLRDFDKRFPDLATEKAQYERLKEKFKDIK